jgi:hypothetical protein
MPMSLFTNIVPTTTDADSVDGEPGVTLGTVWNCDHEGVVRGVKFYLGNRNYDTAGVIGGIFDYNSGNLLASQNYTVSASDPIGYVTIPLSNPVLISRNTRYITAVWFPCDTSPDGKAHYVLTGSFFDEGTFHNPPLHGLGEDTILNRRNGLYKYGATLQYPQDNFNASCYFIDVSFDYVAHMPILNTATGTYERKIIKYRQGGTWHY